MRSPIRSTSRKNHRFPFSWGSLEDRQLLAAPVLDAIPNVPVPATKTYMLPLTATDADGNPLTYMVTSDNGIVTASVRNNHPFLKMSVANFGDMTFQLFDDIAPTAVKNISDLASQGLYNGLTFHRVIQNFMIQGGDPLGTGTGSLLGSTKFSDEFSPDAIFSGNGQLASANSGKDTNGSQFFITSGQQRFLDFNHNIFGQMVRGFDVQQAISAVPVDANSKPLTPVIMTSMSMVTDTADTVLELKSSGVGITHFTVTVSDGHGGTDTKTFTATSVTDTTNDPPILGFISNQVTYTNAPIDLTLNGFDFENDPLTFAGQFYDPTPPGTFKVNSNVITITPNTGYKGTFTFFVGVMQTGATSRGSTSSPWDLQAIQVKVGDPFTIATQAVSLEEGLTLAGTTIANFTPLKAKAASSYEASIDYGDGRIANGTVLGNGDGTYVVKGTGAYQKFGTYPIKITIKDLVDNVSISGTTTATISDAPLSVAFANPLASPGSGLIISTFAEITDTNPLGITSDLNATITWGDGKTSSGLISKVNGKILVNGSKAYDSFGTFAITISVKSTGGQAASASTSIVVANAVPVFAPLAAQSTTQGTTLIFQAKATDTDTWQTLTYQFSSAVPDYITMQPATGIISISNKAPAGTLNFNVVVKDNGTPYQSAQIPISVTVNPLPPPPPPPIVQPISIVAIKTKTGQVTLINITFSDAINATSATKIANYKLISSAGKDKKYYTKDDILLKIGSVKYNAATRTITIMPSAKLVPTVLTNIRLIASGLFDNLGQAVDGNRDKLAGGDLLATLTKSSIVLI